MNESMSAPITPNHPHIYAYHNKPYTDPVPRVFELQDITDKAEG